MAGEQNIQSIPEGPPIFENWHAKIQGLDALSIYEYPLLTDARITGEAIEGYGPYKFLNPIQVVDRPGLVRPAIILRFEHFLAATRLDFKETNTTYYHGGWLPDEVTALVSLCLGIRLKAGGSTRRFEPHGDPLGRPTAWEDQPEPVVTIKSRSLILPSVVGVHSVDDLLPLKHIPYLSAQDVVALIRAARLYQDALWISELEPALSWIMLVSALEAGANHWKVSHASPLERLEASKPDLTKLLLQYGGGALAEQVAAMIADSLGSTGKFISFVLKYMPAAPIRRPFGGDQVPWSKTGMKKILQKVYEYRSKALHGGHPFPAPMCEPPYYQEGWEAPAEAPLGLATCTMGGVWLAEDTPILLHIFEYITRGTLLNWLKDMANP